MNRIWFALAGAALCASAPCLAQGTSPALASVQLSKVILDTETTAVKGKLKGGTLCVFPSAIKMTREKKTEDYERFDQLFSARMREFGFKVVTTSADLFASDDDKNKAAILIGAVVHPDTINLCSSVNGEKGEVTLLVDWQVYDQASHRVVATLTTTGHGAQEKFARDGLLQMWNRAFIANLEALVAQGTIQPYTGQPVPPPAPPAPPLPPPVAPTTPASK